MPPLSLSHIVRVNEYGNNRVVSLSLFLLSHCISQISPKSYTGVLNVNISLNCNKSFDLNTISERNMCVKCCLK
jgi:hypothetical protein